jgi:heat shock protein HtpX
MSPAILLGRRVSHALQTAALLGAMALLAGYLGWALLGTGGLVVAMFVVVLVLAYGPRVSPRLLLRFVGASELSAAQAPGLHHLVEALSERAGLARAPRLFHVPTQVLNAFAIGQRSDAAIAVTDGLLRRLAPREIAGVLAHEIAHVRSNDIWVMTLAELASRMTGTLSFFGMMLLFVMLPLSLFGAGGMPFLPVLVMLFAPIISAALQLALSRTREYDADIGAIELTGDPRGLASALDMLEKLQGGWMERMFMARVPQWLRSHPETKERIRRLMALEGSELVRVESGSWASDPFLGQPRVERAPRWHWSGSWH